MKRTASAVWQGGLKDGQGSLSTQSGVLQATPYGFRTRFEDEPGTNPEELIAAAHAACFTMALAFQLQSAGLKATSLHGNQICAKCVERVEALELCAACLLPIEEKDADGPEVAVFAGHIYCRSCTRRVRLTCSVCRKEAALSGPEGDGACEASA